MWVFSHVLGVDLKRNPKNLVVCLLRQTSHRRVLFLSGETILCTFNRQTNSTGLLSQFYRYLFTFTLFCLSLLLSLAVFLSAFIKLARLSPTRQIPPSLWKDTHLPCSQIPAMFSGNITLLLKSSHGRAGASLSGPNATNYLKGRHQSDSLQWAFTYTREKLSVWVNERPGIG